MSSEYNVSNITASDGQQGHSHLIGKGTEEERLEWSSYIFNTRSGNLFETRTVII
jgi:hypothetical protein